MKKIAFLIASIVSITASAQTTLYSEDFESVSHTFTLNTTDVSSTAAGYNPWLVNNVYAGGSGSLVCLGFPFAYTVNNTVAQPGGITSSPNSYNMHITSQEAINDNIFCGSYQPADGTCYFSENNFTKMTADISTTGLTGISFDFWWICGGAVGTTYGELYYSIDGGSSWVLEQTNLNNNTSWIQASLTNAAWNNQATLRFGFRFVNLVAVTGLDPGLSIDDIKIIHNCPSTSSSITTTACDSYTSPSGNHTWTSTNTYKDTIPNFALCDSIITINLTINSVDSGVTQAGTLLTADESGAGTTYQWLDCPGMTLINGATNQSYTATGSGDYAVAVTKNGCTDTSACYTVTIVGLIENDFGNELQLYPNPTNGNFSIDLGENHSTVSITMTDLSGKLILSKTYNDSQLLQLKIAEPAGVYLLMIESGNQKAIIRLVKE